MGKKIFNVGERSEPKNAALSGAGLIESLLGDIPAAKSEEKKPKPKADKPVSKPQSNTPVSKPQEQEEEPSALVPERKKAKKETDLKKPFSSILKESLQTDLKDVLKLYRQNVDYEYNGSQFLEDAVVAQLTKLKKQLKKTD